MQYEVIDVLCPVCKHKRILTVADAEELTVCRVCGFGDGKIHSMQTFEVCGACGQTMYQRHCWCKNTQPYSKVVVDPFNKWTKEKTDYHQNKREQAIEAGKLERLIVKKQIEIKNQPLKIQKEILSELQKLTKKEEVKSKKFDCEAIQ